MNRPGGGASNRPSQLPSNRPSAGDLGNFLNMPTQGGAVGNRPSQLPANRPSAGSERRPDGGFGFTSQLPANRPGGGLLGPSNRPGGIGDAGGIGRPGGVGGVGGVGNRPSQLPARGDRSGWNNYRNNRANSVRNWTQNNHNYNRVVNRGGWWGGGYGHGFAHGWAASNAYHGWGGCWGWHGYPPGYWWGFTTSVVSLSAYCVNLFATPPQPVYYDYGNTVYVDNRTVYIEEKPVASQEEYASQAIQYANVPVPPPPEIKQPGAETPEEDAAMKEFAENWMPLGVFAVSNNKDDSSPSHYLQLAVSKDGYIAGTCYNSIKDETLPITGSVDKESQRAAWKMGDNADVVMETGIFNLTQDTAPAMLHFGKDKSETRLLVRMEKPKEEKSQE